MRRLGHAMPIVFWWLLPWARQTASMSSYDATVCNQKTYTSPSDKFIYVPNAWNPNDQGFQCMSVRTSPPAFDATWRWPSVGDTVHSYPHVKFPSEHIPIALSKITALHLSAQWSMGPGSDPIPVPSVNTEGLESLDVRANVAFDLFADRNAANAETETKAETEIMIWLGTFGSPQPLGFNDNTSNRATINLDGVDFTLYHGRNQRDTGVFTWIAAANTMKFSADVSPLLQHLWRNGLVSADSLVGVVGFGSEAFRSVENVTFSASDFGMQLLTGEAPILPASPTPSSRGISVHRCPGSWPLSSGMTIFLGSVGAILYNL
ncbi:family 12 putative glycoside hydrolase [Podospora australis]|uniref:Family 12 putative glycoside hydrolase n=1 Tax=Podospora australis TaxID=1536484 RepID=A0AAN6WKN0_9PEZI|nr:family 12 putative glycoside hydrolase [Podospora australis]